jgi:hypothetical protein
MVTRRGDDENVTDYFSRLASVETQVVRLDGKQKSHEDICAIRYAAIEASIRGVQNTMDTQRIWGLRIAAIMTAAILLGGHAALKMLLGHFGIQLP